MKKCRCGETNQANFYKDKNGRFGLRSICKACDIKKAQKWNKDNADRHYLHQKSWRENNRQASRDQVYKYVDKNRYKKNAWCAKYRAQKLNATLPGFDKEIENIYKSCPKGYHVDHIIPLQGNNVCGLHVPWNLRVITAEENLRKHNKIIDEAING